jgi:type III secretory pathway component EscR
MVRQFNSNRVLNLRFCVLELVISGAVMMLGIFMGLPMNDSSSGISLLSGAALLVAGVVGFRLTMKSILKY